MMVALNSMSDKKRELYFIVFHVAIGVLAAILPFIVPFYILCVILLYLFKYGIEDVTKINTIIFISYLTGLEILYRVSGVSFLPYETSKYIQICFIIWNIVISKTWFNSKVGILIVLLLLPSIIIYPPPEYKYFVFNTMGMFALGLLIAFIAYTEISFKNFLKILRAFLYTTITFVTFITIKTPALSDIEFELGANEETSGGFGTNQVATIIGASLCLLIIMIDQRHYLYNRVITIITIIYFALRGLLTFSRGGIFGVVLSIIVSFIFYKKLKQKNIIQLVVLGVATTAIFIIANNLTGGLLLLRYQGETAGTLAGTREKDAKVLASGRTIYAQVDLDLFMDHPFLGVGPGNSQFQRYKYNIYDEAAPHTETTRLLGENGLFGLGVNLILILWPIYVIRKTPERSIRFIKSVLFLFAYATTYHSAMRTGITPLFYGIASMNINFPDEFIKEVS